ncbi:hypothetical protein [Nocardioides sp. cx-173]|uniref:hypothetical protein n=1 Tax=Nocardioides sp. cx-173 TaxID=2898796 RepID=UPI001E30086C|nr:hypothetical protein [Nocardioides sp. cx-173]MCD4527207.1 hypothetical protein [Nocardioides sp. cx-173]UGB40436.1 hypothetical protein LQ940_13730 [Nocardioides sp. cx-173]
MVRPVVLISSLVLMCAVLVGCSEDSGDSGDDPDGSGESTSQAASPTPTPTEEPYLSVPDGVELTEPGSRLRLGEQAVVAYRPRQGIVGALDVTVRRIVRTTFQESFSGWRLSDQVGSTTPYFVYATVTNVGASDLGGRAVPLYGVDSGNRLIEASTFEGSFKPCPSLPFPRRFRPGATHQACLVFLAPAKTRLKAVAFRPSQEFNPITWTGKINKITKPKPKPKKGKGKGGA